MVRESIRFHDKYRKNPGENGCWVWSRACLNGYGYFRTQTTQYAHRASWEMHFGPIPKDMRVCHKCDNTRCVRPDHLFLGTQRDNIHDMISKGRRKFGISTTKTKLSTNQVADIKHKLKGGFSLRGLAREYKVSSRSIGNIRNGHTWAHVEPRAERTPDVTEKHEK